MPGIITEKRKMKLIEIRKDLTELANQITDIIDGNSSMFKLADALGLTPQMLNTSINEGLHSLLRRAKILDKSDVEQLLKDSSSPSERLIRAILGTNELIILSLPEEDLILKIMEDTLNEKEYKVIKQLYGFDCEVLSQEKIAESLNVTRTRIEQIKRNALKKLRNPRLLKMLLNCDINAVELKEEETMTVLNEQLQSSKDGNYDDISIKELNVSKRIYYCLNRAGINTIGELSKCPISKLMRIRNMGYKSLEELINVLANQYNIIIGDDVNYMK